VRAVGRIPDLIGIGAQRSGTSWIYACLYEHPEACLPVKEAHFFSRERNWPKGYDWYETIFDRCPQNATVGEFSTSYLSDPETPKRIYQRYPQVKLIASLRNPVTRAYSNYLNDLKAGAVKREVSFWQALQDHPEYIDQGRYATQLKQYFECFPREQLLVCIYEDCLKDPLGFIQGIYRFIEIDSSFSPALVNARVNEGQVPRFFLVNLLLTKTSEALRKMGLHRIWWLAKKTNFANRIRHANTLKSGPDQYLSPPERADLYGRLEGEIDDLERLIGRNLSEWRL
jgi:hypothetical protein